VNGLAAYLSMSGYAAFVWPAYGAALAVMGALAIWSWRAYRLAARALERLQADAQSRG
jgi:heme exporter protein CcmD